MKASRYLIIALIGAMPTIALAHPGHSLSNGFVAGVAHPWSGIDHLAAMLTVGLWAAQLGGRMRWMLPISFVTLMLAGAMVGASGVQLGAAEQGIAASVFVLGLLLATAVRLPTFICVALVGVFAVFHGYAHGAEQPMQTNTLIYMSGFAFSTIVLHGLGVAAAQWLLHYQRRTALRWTGFAVAATGLGLLLT